MKSRKLFFKTVALSACLFAGMAFSQESDFETFLRNLCLKGDTHPACKSDVEKKALNTFPDIARRTDKTLCLYPKEGAAVCFTDNWVDNDGEVYYDYRGQLPHWPSIAVVYAQYWEGSQAIYISLINGKTLFKIVGYVSMSPSPNAEYAAFSMVDEADFFDTHGAWLYQISDVNEWSLLWSSENRSEAYTNVRWDNDSQLRITRSTWVMDFATRGNKFEPQVLGELIVTKKNGIWSSVKDDVKK